MHNKLNADKYVMISNGTNTWSVQVKDTVFFKKMSHKEEIAALRTHYEKELQNKDAIIAKLKKYIQAKIKNGDIQPNVSSFNKSKTTSLKKPSAHSGSKRITSTKKKF